ncbi:hypothetical protein QQ008_03455 [Fulvivirgaceae bacterium BMA10]|uniref:CHRD domain-containing protein n=1 Tax=Splendidivirga corallicola TaxID=3051826 RepID=A0ABT8KI53_9BACT|nr:hypothetical protein [Fulvivirgaceae bacterium BMA10]
MRKNYSILVAFLVFSCVFVVSCSDSEPTNLGEFTGNEVTYQLFSASDYNIAGHIIFKQKTDNGIQAEVSLQNTQDGALHPLHLHYGAIGNDGDLALLLEPIKGLSGKSTTVFSILGDESKFTYDDLLNFDGSVKVHLDDGLNRDVVLAGGNIGKNNLNSTSIKACTDFTDGI